MSNIAPETLQKIRDQLQAAKMVNGAVPADLYSHLTEVFNRIMQHHHTDAFDKFEEISTLVKRTHFNFADPKHDHEVNASGAASKTDDELRQAWITASTNLLKEVNSMVSKGDQELLSKQKKFVTPNFEQMAEMLEWAGISFGEEEMHKLNKSIKRLAEMSGASKIVFKGKVYGTNKDYWVCSGTLPGDEETSIPEGQEPRGTGVNESVYWVTDHLLSDWIQLPDCHPEHIKAARKIKHVLTGELNAAIDSNPLFPGKERHFLRAQLSRIFHGTELCPKGVFEIDEETNAVKFAEEFTCPSTKELDSQEAWGNALPQILKAGTVTHAKPAGMDEEEATALMDKLAETDPVGERFRDIAQHEMMPGTELKWWTNRICGDTQDYQTPGGGPVLNYAVNVLRSLKWPGAVTVSKGGKWHSLYIGYGLKRGDPSFDPTEPPEVQADPQDQNEMPEPTPLQAPQEPPEPDTDAKPEGDEEEAE